MYPAYSGEHTRGGLERKSFMRQTLQNKQKELIEIVNFFIGPVFARKTDTLGPVAG